MLYAAINERDWPDGFEEIAWLGKRLKQYGYTVDLEAKLFGGLEGVPYKVSIIKWEHSHFRPTPKREEVGTYEDKTEAANMIRFLLNVVEEQLRERS